MRAILVRLFAGKTLGRVLEVAAAEHDDPQQLVIDLQIWVREWVSGGCLPPSRARDYQAGIKP